MTLPRSTLIDRQVTPYYHCISRCVRRALLCGHDPVSGFNFEHRRRWIENRLQELAAVFALDLCGYAVMSNHYHVVVHLNDDHKKWSDEETMVRWAKIHRIPDSFNQLHPTLANAQVEIWRERLGSISWFMKCVNEPLARLANREDGCKGRFWEGRFKSQALLDNEAVLKGMVYVDLNPVRARLARTPEDSEYTSVQARIESRARRLAPMNDHANQGFRLPFSLKDYLVAVDWTGRQLRPDKRGSIDSGLPPIISRLAKTSRLSWLQEMQHLTRKYYRAIGGQLSLEIYRDHLGQQKLKGLTC